MVESSIVWGVVPVQPSFRDWLTAAGLEIPPVAGRYPTLEELNTVLQSFEGLPIQQEEFGGSAYAISLGKPSSEQYAYLLGGVQDNLFQFHFYMSGPPKLTMMQILKKLAGICGPFILYEIHAATPVIIDSSTNLEQALENWLRRTQQNSYPK